MLLNVGPDARGNFPEESVRILEGIGKWMKMNGKSIYGCGISGLPKPDFGRITAKDNRLYFHIFENTIGPVPLTGLNEEDLESIRLLSDGHEIRIPKNWITGNYPGIVFADLGPDPVLPDPVDTVLEVTLKEK
jgi:alpha-L-fucosidase